MNQIQIPVVGIGPGSQPGEDDGATLDYLSMPQGMAAYVAPLLPERDELRGGVEGLRLLEQLHRMLGDYRVGQPPGVIDLSDLDAAGRELVCQTLGEGEVSALWTGPAPGRAQETRLAGVWWVWTEEGPEGSESHRLEVADIPGPVRARAFAGAGERVDIVPGPAEGVVNAPSLLVELNDKVRRFRPGDESRVLNLTLLPQTEQDLAFLDRTLGRGQVSMLSRGYGNCRITATGLSSVWWVQYFNSQETLILNTLEVVDVPTAALAAQADIQDSARRLQEILGALQ